VEKVSDTGTCPLQLRSTVIAAKSAGRPSAADVTKDLTLHASCTDVSSQNRLEQVDAAEERAVHSGEGHHDEDLAVSDGQVDVAAASQGVDAGAFPPRPLLRYSAGVVERKEETAMKVSCRTSLRLDGVLL
jgi:hypothetical protein